MLDFIQKLKSEALETVDGMYNEDPDTIGMVMTELRAANTYVGVMHALSTVYTEKDAWWIVHKTIMRDRIEFESLRDYGDIEWPDYS